MIEIYFVNQGDAELFRIIFQAQLVDENTVRVRSINDEMQNFLDKLDITEYKVYS